MRTLNASRWPFDYPSVMVTEVPGDDTEDDEIESNKKCYHLFIDKVKILASYHVEEISQALISSNFVFNKLYPKVCAASLEFMQMYFANIFTNGARSKLSKLKEKALTLNNGLKNLAVTDFLEKGEIDLLDSDLID
ncbi:hypothetical protein QAD02_017613 [Eretmocerus hayati]|uniref:Uncharacterized protein n=1 Tax=Eretmocerus hayati TaxID=131215 RepID=A0ACC2PG74_9HYME|nr:hypothetical protein QAD02_017613 [Eretmocerus hayati]